MKAEYERIEPDHGSSFRFIDWESVNDRFYWHHHPEYEIIYVKKGRGRRQIGTQIAPYEEGELVLMGPNLPHLGFGYGVEGEHREFIVQFKADFLGEHFLAKPELHAVRRLFERAKQGVCFGGATADVVGQRLHDFKHLPPFERLVELLKILNIMASSAESHTISADGAQVEFSSKEKERIEKIYQFVSLHFRSDIQLPEVAEIVGLTVPSFCRYFKKITQMTFTDFVNEYRINQAQKLLSQGSTVIEACFESGFNTPSHFNKTFKDITGKSPSVYQAEIMETL